MIPRNLSKSKMYLQHDIATDKELASCCARSNLDRDVLYELHGRHSVIRVSSDAVIKCGFGVTQEEATSQIRAYNLIDQTIIRVPRVHRFFTYKNIGHIVMEFIDGEPLNSTEDLAACGGIAKALAHFSQIRNDLPGPLSGGLAYGLLWIEGDWISPTSAEDVENYFNTRQLQHHEKLNIKDQAFSLCHLDIAPRNVLRLRNGSLCLLDWASAEFYPRFFEVCTLRLNNIRVDQVFSLEALNQHEQKQARLLEKAYYLKEKHAYHLPARKRKKQVEWNTFDVIGTSK